MREVLNMDRATQMVLLYGESVTKAKAAQILNRGRGTIYAMLEDGRLEQFVDGRIDVRSIAEYLTHKPQSDFAASIKRRYGAQKYFVEA